MKIRVLLGACLLSLLSGSAGALGLGEILVNSRLNQPLDAEIVVRESSPGEAERLVAKLASQEDFARVGLERARTPVMLRFETTKNARGQTIIKVTSDEPVREPFLTLLVEANWSGGRLLREYGLLLDPAVAAPASRIVRTPAAAPPPAAAAPAPAPAPTGPVATTRPISEPAPAPAAAPAPAQAPAPRPAPPPTGFAAPPSQPAAPPPASQPSIQPVDGRYEVQRGDTLSGIASAIAADAGVSTNQMMLALQRTNPNAFFADNINALKAGVVLRVPEAEEARSISQTDARAEVRRQIDSWTGVATTTAAPATSLADAGAAPSATVRPTQAPTSEPRLELVPPGADEPGSEAAGRPGSGQGGVDVAQAQSELQRTREELRSRGEEVSELNSRVRDLEELNAKNARLLELKNAEVAELQRRLAEAQAAGETAPPAQQTVGAATPAVEEAAAGDAAEQDVAGTAAESAPDQAIAAAADPADMTGDGADDAAAAGDDIAAAGNEPDEPASDPESAAGEESPRTADAQAPAGDDQEMTDAEWEAAATGSSADPFAGEDAGATGDSWAPAAPAASTLAPEQAAATAAVTQPVQPQALPWYKQPLVQGAGLIGLALLLLLVMLARRQRSQAAKVVEDAPKRSVSELFGDTPTPLAGAATAAAAGIANVDEIDDVVELQRQITADPDNFGAYLELLSIHYANRDRDSFETWAERFYDRPGAEGSVEWDQVCGMGEELLPDHPLFDQAGEDDADAGDFGDEYRGNDDQEAAPPPAVAHAPAAAHEESDADRLRGMSDSEFDSFTASAVQEDDVRPIEFSLDDLDAPAAPPSAQQSAAVTSAASLEEEAQAAADSLPPLDFETGASDFAADAPPAPLRLEESDGPDSDSDSESLEGGLDDAATKLELARAYLDMGDPEGARAMLEEVLGEGDTGQRAEARRLLAML